MSELNLTSKTISTDEVETTLKELAGNCGFFTISMQGGLQPIEFGNLTDPINLIWEKWVKKFKPYPPYNKIEKLITASGQVFQHIRFGDLSIGLDGYLYSDNSQDLEYAAKRFKTITINKG